MGEPRLRRPPSQARGQRRVEAILAAAAALFDEVGYDAATTNAIAARASTAIGSLYQFFPDKEAILRALVDRYLRELRAIFDEALDPQALRLPLPALLDRAIDPLAGFYAAHRGVRPLVRGVAPGTPLGAAGAALHAAFVDRVDTILAARAPILEVERRRLVAAIVVELVKAALPLATADDGGRRDAVVAEVKRLLLAYLGPILAAGGGPDPALDDRSLGIATAFDPERAGPAADTGPGNETEAQPVGNRE